MKASFNLEFSGPANYKIFVQGKINERWAEKVGGMRIENSINKKGQAITILEGLIQDQAELSGILNTLYDLHLSVISVKCTDVNNK